MFERRWSSSDERFQVEFSELVCTSIAAYVDRTHPYETGGVLVGRYAKDNRVAFVTEASSAPEDSEAGRHWFRRGNRGLARWFEQLWSGTDRRYYLGEWHYHPSTVVVPSPDDVREMQSIARAARYACAAPVLLIVGMQVEGRRNACVLVIPRDSGVHHLAPLEELP